MSNSRTGVVCLSLAGVLCITLFTGLVWGFEPKDPNRLKSASDLSDKEFFIPELYISSAYLHVDQVLAELPNRVAWESFQAARVRAGQARMHAFVDPRSGTAASMIDAGPLIPGKGLGNQVTLAKLSSDVGYKVDKVGSLQVADAVLGFVKRNQEVLGIDMVQLGMVRASQISPALWHVRIQQAYHGVPVRHGHMVATISHGNLVLVGTETWGHVRGLSHTPRLSGDEAMTIGFDYAGTWTPADDIVLRPTLEIVPVAPLEHQEGQAFRGPIGDGFRHRLVWTFRFRRAPEPATWEVMVDAHSAEVIAFQDVNAYADIKGGVYPVTSTEICPTPGTCGVMQSGWPMPWADTGLSSPNDYTNSGGVFNGSGTTTTTLSGIYVDVYDYCGSLSNSGSPDIDLGGVNGDHDCDSGGGSAGNTPASRTAFYEVNKLAEMARGWLPGNSWLQDQLRTNVNINNTCNAYWNGVSINFYRSGGGCRNTGELAGVFDHEWGHGLDYNDSNGSSSNPGEAYADIVEIYRLHHSCIGHGFWWTSNKGCGMTVDGTGYNANESQTGTHCDLDCSGVRDADWDKHADHTPDTPLAFVCPHCLSSSGPCGRQVHCSAAPPRQAAWDLVKRDLPSEYGTDNETAFIIGNKLFYHGSGNIGAWYTCTCGVSSGGCGSTNAYMQWLAADDDDGNISNGTPHMTALYNAFNRHEIACATPTPVNSGCGGGPSGSATLTPTEGDHQVSLSWTAVTGASKYWVLRTEGHAGCDLGKALIAETTGLTYTDTEVANGREYYYNVVAVGTSDSCFGPVSNCAAATPAGTGNTPPVVTITAPPDGSSYPEGTSITFTGTAIDAEDGDISTSISWSSNHDGALGTGDSITTSTLSVNVHTITASATDSGSLTGSDSITVTIQGDCLPKGASCTTDDECCSLKCRGSAGKKRCR
jgi:hypothetical protein